MKTLDDIFRMHKEGLTTDLHLTPLSIFLRRAQLADLDISKDHPYNILKFNRKNVVTALKNHVEHGFKRALAHKAIGAEMMFKSVRTLNWVLEEGLENFNEFDPFGLPLFKATAQKYGFADPIQGFTGSESGFSDNWE
jgi:hypothetical protein